MLLIRKTLPEIDGKWYVHNSNMYMRGESNIIQYELGLVLVNEFNQRSRVYFITDSIIVAIDWSNAIGEISPDLQNINWGNGIWWVKNTSENRPIHSGLGVGHCDDHGLGHCGYYGGYYDNHLWNYGGHYNDHLLGYGGHCNGQLLSYGAHCDDHLIGYGGHCYDHLWSYGGHCVNRL